MNAFFFPRLHKVEALAPYNLRTWSTGEVLDVDVERPCAPILHFATSLRLQSLPLSI